MNAILEALDREPLAVIKSLLDRNQFQRLVEQKYQQPAEQQLQPDSEESQEAAEVDEKRMSAAAAKWAQLESRERMKVMDACEAIYGDGSQDEMAELLSLRLV